MHHSMSLITGLASSKSGFFLLNLIIVAVLYMRIEEPLPFFFIAGGIVTFSYFVKRAISQFIDGK